MDIGTVNYLAVLVAGIAAMAIGFTWYHPKVFGSAWMREAGISPEGGETMTRSMAIGFLAALVTAYVLAQFAVIGGAATYLDAIVLAFWVWLGFQVTLMVGSVIWEKKSWTYFLINGSHQLVSLIAISLIVTLWV